MTRSVNRNKRNENKDEETALSRAGVKDQACALFTGWAELLYRPSQ
jgi:hypothetical protein